MRTVPISSTLRLLEPRSLKEALAMLRDEGPLIPLAGCTDVYVNLNFGTSKDTRFLNLWASTSCAGSRSDDGLLSIGALATYTEIIRSPLVRKRLPMLAAAAREIGGVQIQNRGTLGGNVANASPAGDTLPVLAAAEAVVVLKSAGGTRRVPFNSFYTGYRKTVMRPDELIVAIEIPRRGAPVVPQGRHPRRAGDLEGRHGGASARRGPRIALGSVAPTVVRLPKTEAVLAAGGSIEEARETLGREIQPIDDLRSTAEYRRRVCGKPARTVLEGNGITATATTLTPGGIAAARTAREANAAFSPGVTRRNRPRRQPVHTVYGGAQVFQSDSAAKLGALALHTLEEFAPDAETFGRC